MAVNRAMDTAQVDIPVILAVCPTLGSNSLSSGNGRHIIGATATACASRALTQPAVRNTSFAIDLHDGENRFGSLATGNRRLCLPARPATVIAHLAPDTRIAELRCTERCWRRPIGQSSRKESYLPRKIRHFAESLRQMATRSSGLILWPSITGKRKIARDTRG